MFRSDSLRNNKRKRERGGEEYMFSRERHGGREREKVSKSTCLDCLRDRKRERGERERKESTCLAEREREKERI